jgi:hypothetical protein
MTLDQASLARGRMKQQPFVPSEGPIEFHSVHALNYIAFYLGEIDQTMERIAKALEAIQASSAGSGATLKMIQTALLQR